MIHWKPGDRATLRDLGNPVEITQILGNGRVQVRLIPHGGLLILNPDQSLVLAEPRRFS